MSKFEESIKQLTWVNWLIISSTFFFQLFNIFLECILPELSASGRKHGVKMSHMIWRFLVMFIFWLTRRNSVAISTIYRRWSSSPQQILWIFDCFQAADPNCEFLTFAIAFPLIFVLSSWTNLVNSDFFIKLQLSFCISSPHRPWNEHSRQRSCSCSRHPKIVNDSNSLPSTREQIK